MATLFQHALDYFSGLNPLAKRILQEQDVIRKSHGEAWGKLSREEQDDLFDEHFIGQDIKDKYNDTDDAEDFSSSFPKLLVNCGEKIVVDFDKEVSFKLKSRLKYFTTPEKIDLGRALTVGYSS